MRHLNERYFIPATKKNISELKDISQDFEGFVQRYVLYLKQVEKKYKDDKWAYGYFFCSLLQFCQEEFKKFRLHQVEVSALLRKHDHDELSSLKLFLLHVNPKKEMSFEALLVYPLHHLQAILHCTHRLCTLTLSTHHEYREINDAHRSFEQLNKELSSIKEQDFDEQKKLSSLSDLIDFTAVIPRLVINDGNRKLVYEGKLKLLQEKGSRLKFHELYAFLFNDIILFCKINSKEDIQEDEEDEEEEAAEQSVQIKEPERLKAPLKKYAALATIPLNSTFLVDPVDGIEDNDKKPQGIELKLEIVETGASIHKILFESVSEKAAWKSHIYRLTRQTVFTYSIVNQKKHYVSLMASSSLDKLSQVGWPHSFSLKSLSDKEILVHPPQYTPSLEDYDRLRTEIASIDDKYEERLNNLSQSFPSPSKRFESKSKRSSKKLESSTDQESLDDIKKLYQSLAKSLDAEILARKESEARLSEVTQRYNELVLELTETRDSQLRMKESFETHLIKLREQHELDIENMMRFIDAAPQKTITANPPVSDKSRKRRETRRVSEKNLRVEDAKIASPRDRSLSASQGLDSESSSKNDRSGSFQSNPPPVVSLASVSNSQSDTQGSGKKVKKLKNIRFDETPTWRDRAIKKLSLGAKKDKNQRPWRKTPDDAQVANGKPLYVKPTKKVDLSNARSENYYSDDFTSDYEGYYGNIIIHSDYAKHDYGSDLPYTSECSDDEMIKSPSSPHVHQQKL